MQCTVFPIDKQGSKEKSQELLDREWMNYLTTLKKIPSNLSNPIDFFTRTCYYNYTEKRCRERVPAPLVFSRCNADHIESE